MTSLERWLFLAHILGAIVWVGGGLMLSLVGYRARKGKDPARIKDFAQMLSYVGLRFLMPAVVIVLVSGVWLILRSSRWAFTDLWVLLGLGAFVAAFLIGAVYQSRIAVQLERLTTTTDVDPNAVRDLLGRWLLGYGAILVILLFVVWDMVFKPAI